MLNNSPRPAPSISGLLGFLLFLIWLTASGDVLFNINLGGSVRYTQLLSVVFIASAMIAFKKPDYSVPITWIIVFSLINVSFVFNSAFPLRGWAYAFWLFLNVGYLIAFASAVRSDLALVSLTRIYVLSGLFVAVFGLVILLLEKAGLYFEFQTQPGRINGFSYEPSYFATYLVPFWVILCYTIERKKFLWSLPWDCLVVFVLSVAIILSTARTGILAMGLWAFRLLLLSLWDLIKGRFVSRPQWLFMLFLFLVGGAAIVLVYVVGIDWYSYLNGTGLFDTASHSVSERTSNMELTWEIFKNSPIIGPSLGGVAVQIGELIGLTTHTLADAKESEGTSVFLEVLAGTGVGGFICLATALIMMMYRAWRYEGTAIAGVLSRASVWSLLIVLGLLQLNQNILRPYLWYHIAFVIAFASVGYGNKRRASRRPGLQM